MSTANTLVPEGDSLYNDKAKFINLEATSSPLPESVEEELRDLLQLVKIILSQTTFTNISESKSESKIKTTPTTASGTRVSGVLQRYASSIGQQIAVKDEKNNTEKTWKILETDPEIPLKTKAILSLVAFATMYGKVRLATVVDNSNNQLAKSITLLKQQPNVQAGENELKKWFEALSRVIELTLEIADGVMNLKEGQPSRKPMLLSTAACRVINMVVICWSQVVNILIKRNWKDIHLNLWTLGVWERALSGKRREIEEELAKDYNQQASIVPNEKPQGGSCWWKIRHMLSPTTAKSKNKQCCFTLQLIHCLIVISCLQLTKVLQQRIKKLLREAPVVFDQSLFLNWILSSCIGPNLVPLPS